MNLLLLREGDLIAPEFARISGRRADHVLKVLKAREGARLRVGLEGGPLGEGELTEIVDGAITLRLRLEERPPPRAPVTVILAMVRPQIMKRTLQHLATLGSRRIMLIGSRRVEASYFSQRLFDGEEWRHHLRLGLEQAGDTWMPELTIHRRFRPFVEDELPGALEGVSHRFLAHPGADRRPKPLDDPGSGVALAIGPEGGWSDYEVEQFEEAGFILLSLGGRILKVETAIPYLWGALGLGFA